MTESSSHLFPAGEHQGVQPSPELRPRPQPMPQAMKWQENGELASSDLFQLVQRLREVETPEKSNELWRLGHKYPNN